MNFEDIRPYNNTEFVQIIKSLFEVEPLMLTVKKYLPEFSRSQIEDILVNFETIQDFQSQFVCELVNRIIQSSVDCFTYDGLSNLKKEESYLLLSNHRDIVLDSAFINYCLNDKKYNTSEIAIGDNLLSKKWIKKLVRLNKSFIVKRNLPKEEMLSSSKKLAEYINFTLKKKNQSVWIAQREGRSKDGDDKTNPGLLKMFGMAAEGQLLDHIISLNITPVSLSYELDPCDILKLPELLKKEEGELYLKEKGEDEKHMLTGIHGGKGNVHVQFGNPINEKIKKLSGIKNKNQLLKGIAEIIDKEIYQNYYLWNSNYVAYDLLHSSKKYVNHYGDNGKEKFQEYMDTKLKTFGGDRNASDIFLKMYANPVINLEKTSG